MSESAQQPSFTPADAETALAGARDLKHWCPEVGAGRISIDSFELVAACPCAKAATGFYAEVTIAGEKTPVMAHFGDFF